MAQTRSMSDPLLLILAMDQRDSIEREALRADAPPTPAEAARIAANKLLVYRGLLDAVAELPEGARARLPGRRAVRRVAGGARRSDVAA